MSPNKYERHGVEAQCLTCETPERQKQKVSENQNNLDTKNVPYILTKKMHTNI